MILITIWWLQKLRKDRQSVNSGTEINVEKFNLRKLSELEVGMKYQIKISNKFAALENLNDSEDINRAWENIKENMKSSAKDSLGLYELKQLKPWFDEESLQFFYQKKQVKMQRLQDPNQSNVDNLNNVRYKDSRNFRNN